MFAGSDKFSIKFKCDYKDLFTGFGNMNTEIDIQLRNDVVLYVAPIHRVAHALQEPLFLQRCTMYKM